jgi:O-antigen/teichoic acid export membrane protein
MTYGTNVATAVLGLVNVLVVARALGPSGRGDVALLTTISFLTANFALLGVNEANANIAGANEETRPALASNSVLLSLLFGAAAAGIIGGLIAVFPGIGGDVRPLLLALALAFLPVLVLQIYLDYLVQAEYGFVVSNVAWLIGPVTNVVANAALALAGVLTVGRAFGVWLAGQTLGTIILAAFVLFRSAGFGRPDARLARASLGFGLRTHLGRTMMLGNYRFDQWLLGAIAGSRELGLYSVAVAWSEALFFLPTVLGRVQRPDLVRASPDEAAREAAVGFRFATVVTAVLAAALAVLAPVLCVDVFGDRFHGSISQLRILVLGAFGIVALKLLVNAMTARNLPLRGALGVAFAFAATVVLDLALIPSHGGLGAAIASTLAYSFGGIAVAVLFVRAFRLSPAELVPRRGDLRWLWQTARVVRGAPAPSEPERTLT